MGQAVRPSCMHKEKARKMGMGRHIEKGQYQHRLTLPFLNVCYLTRL
ncbi:hypothetical protein HMPREF3213_02903 [Heyndrickxia coagulans]|uniref:Uncharacterized protein n=1 Tax=Heyndrickxia coagulans TaxID=1398 RepID=A0A133KGS6_HEYCO|nr:hypothetical protein HMPREF3213_02903 [Heyndrickxia coagulans]